MAPIKLNANQLDCESNKFQSLFELGESEETWGKFDQAISRMTDITLGSQQLVNFHSTFKTRWKMGIVTCLNSERTKLAKNTLLLVETLASVLKERFDESLLVVVLKLCAKANKIIVNAASSTIISCIQSGDGFASLIPYFVDAHKNASKTFKISAIECLVTTVEYCSKTKLENFTDKIEFAIGAYIVDSVPQVRESARSLFSAYQEDFNTKR